MTTASSLATLALAVGPFVVIAGVVLWRAWRDDRRRREFFEALHEQAAAAAWDGHPRVTYRVSGDLDPAAAEKIAEAAVEKTAREERLR